MVPLTDTLPRDRPPLVTLVLLALGGALLVAEGLDAALATGLVALWIFGSTLEDTTGRPVFLALERAAYDLGFEHVAAGPLVRSSYHADEHVPQQRPGVGPVAASA